MFVREPYQLWVECEHPQLTFGMRLIELTEPNSNITADDDRTFVGLYNDHLHPTCVPRRRNEPKPRKQFKLAVDRKVLHARCIDSFANCGVVHVVRILELLTLNVDRLTSEKVVATTVVEVQVRVDDDINSSEV